MIFYIAAGVLLALKIAGLADAVSWWVIVGVALIPITLIVVLIYVRRRRSRSTMPS